MKNHKTTETEIRLLRLIDNYPGRHSPTRISKVINMSYTNTFRVVNKLIKTNYLRKESLDKRESRLYITDKGKELIKNNQEQENQDFLAPL